MNITNISIQDRTKTFAVRVIKAYVELNQHNCDGEGCRGRLGVSNRHVDDAGKVLSKQFLKSGTSIGANCAEAKAAQSTKDFISKYEIAQKEVQEFIFWCEVFVEAKLVPPNKFSLLLQEANEIGKILTVSIIKLKEKLKT